MVTPSDVDVFRLPPHPAAPRSIGIGCPSNTFIDTDDELPAPTAETAPISPAVVDLPLAAIVVGERHRKTLRNIPQLAASIASRPDPSDCGDPGQRADRRAGPVPGDRCRPAVGL